MTAPLIRWRVWLGEIQPVECERETDSCVWVLTSWDGWRLAKPRREARTTRNHSFHPTWEEARAHLLKLAEEDAQHAEARFQDARRELDRIQALQPPEEP
jgi:hypothetical protein